MVATVLTVYGIETLQQNLVWNLHKWNYVATVLTVYGIETVRSIFVLLAVYKVATVLTVYGIET